jgi:hypothetical protein
MGTIPLLFDRYREVCLQDIQASLAMMKHIVS